MDVYKNRIENEPVPESTAKREKRALFAAAWGTGKPDTKKGGSREQLEYKAGQAAIQEILQYGELCRTKEGDLYFTSTELPWKLVPLTHDDPRLIALLNHVFQVRASSAQAFKLILCSLQNEAFVNGKRIEVRQFCHADHNNKIIYLSLCDGQRLLKLTGTDEDTWDRLPVMANGTDGVYFIDDPSWEAWHPVYETHYFTDEKTGKRFEEAFYNRTIAKRLLVDTIKFKADVLTVEEQQWLMDKVLATLLIDLSEKPLVALIGDNGSGKTFVAETIKTALLGSRAGRAENINKPESLRVSLTSSPLVIIDNLDDVDTFTINGEALLGLARDAGFHNLTVNKIHAEIEALSRVLSARYDMKVTHPGNRKTYTFSRRAEAEKAKGGGTLEPAAAPLSQPQAGQPETLNSEERREGEVRMLG